MRRRNMLIAVVMAGAATAVVVPVQAQAAPGTTPAVVTIGDSYIAGEAGRWKGNSGDLLPGHAGTDRAHIPFRDDDPARVYGTTAGTCDRSDVAPVISAAVPGLTPINLACSGARTVNVLRAASGGVAFQGEAPQNDQLAAVATKYQVKVIALSIGGNDLGFTPILQSCIQAYVTRGEPCSKTQQATLDAKLPGIEKNIEAVIDDVQGTMTDAGYAPGSYQFIFQSYPNPLAPRADFRYPGQGIDRINIGGCPFYDKDTDWAAQRLIPGLTGIQAQAVKATGIQFLDLEQTMIGHRLCDQQATQPVGYGATPSPSTSEWIRFIDLFGQGTLSESLHPNYFGQQAMGTCLRLAIAAARDASCTGSARIRPGQVHL